jgi:hypothetical protein
MVGFSNRDSCPEVIAISNVKFILEGPNFDNGPVSEYDCIVTMMVIWRGGQELWYEVEEP